MRAGPTTDGGGGRCDARVTRTGPTTDGGGGAMRCDARETRTGPTTDGGGGGGGGDLLGHSRSILGHVPQ